MDVYILGIESSCDDTSAAVTYNNVILSNVIANQEVHWKYGGVVPELASRAHQQNIIPVIDLALHNQIVLVKDFFDMEIIGRTIDDAAGEAFDKAAKIMGLSYPGGPLIDRFAQNGNPNAFKFPRPNIQGLDFSFSGVKTSFLYFLRDRLKEDTDFIEKNKADLCASIQHTIVGILMEKLMQASAMTGINEIAIAGGVSANTELRQTLLARQRDHKLKTYIPHFEYSTDNAAMIAVAGYFKFLKGHFADQGVAPYSRNSK
jgi:N6-L-threonylcarbamoyladenine synthase